jgi:hypothetical protein
MRCEAHETDASGACPFCGRAFCSRCAVVRSGARCACSDDCLDGLLLLDESATLSVTKGKKTLKANVTFCIFMGAVFILIGLVPLIVTRSLWPLTVFLAVVGLAFMAGGLIYAQALRETK